MENNAYGLYFEHFGWTPQSINFNNNVINNSVNVYNSTAYKLF